MKLGKNDLRYQHVKKQSLAYGETNDCAVISMAITTGLPYAKVHDLFARCGRPFRKGTWPWWVNGVLNMLGMKSYRYNQYEIAYMAKKIGVKQLDFDNVTRAVEPGKRYLLISRKHSAAIIDQKIVDWSDGTDRKVIGLVEFQ